MTSKEPIRPSEPASSGNSIGQSIDEGKGRVFPCDGCGADLKFHIGQQRLKCPFCGFEQALQIDPQETVGEQDLHEILRRQVERRAHDAARQSAAQEVQCPACGAVVAFTGPLTSTECAYCASPVQREHVHDATDRIPVDGVAPFQVQREKAQSNLQQWVRSRWFAPNDFRERGVQGKFNGIYLPFWTFDSMTANQYHGQRGEHYWVTVGSGKNERRERRTRWYSVSGDFQRFFDDVLVCAAANVPRGLVQSLEPWPLAECLPFNQQMLAGLLAQTYTVSLGQGLEEAKLRMEQAIEREVRSRIGGDEQRVDSLVTHFGALTYKHLLLPVWLLAYKYRDKSYQVVVNAVTGEVQGHRPYSWIKIALVILASASVVGVAALLISQAG